ncbi:oxidoreductase [Enemella evansiae]|uniref:Gfo/Idh/MocA family protein n=1 Tax=Enemella evansiae TaxID=2016499 RepID=UPI000B9670AB|nr:Gfo/Idh/MocA family oxidoreductase [Enemella evansiae]OYO15497.1 oxidoreductase [Enemella evansiae]
MSPRVRVGVLGTSSFAVRKMLPGLSACPSATLVTVGTREPAGQAEFARGHGCRIESYEEVLAATDVDAVYVPLPAALHYPWALKALEAGKHVLSEKPAALTVEQATILTATAQERGLVLDENVMFVHHPQHQTVRELLGAGRLGTVREFRAVFTVPFQGDRDIRYSPELGGGALWDTGVYPVRAAQMLFDDVDVVSASYVMGTGGVDVAGVAVMRSGGVIVQVSFGIDHAYQNYYEVVGSTGRLRVERAFTPPADFRPEIVLTSGTGSDRLSTEPADQVMLAWSAFTERVLTADTSSGSLAAHASVLETLALQPGGPLARLVG